MDWRLSRKVTRPHPPNDPPTMTVIALTTCLLLTADSLPPLGANPAPRNLAELWGDYDPRAEPLDATVVREWREGAATVRYVTFAIGTFKGRPARLAAFYAFPTGATAKLPGLLHLHGGGQRASLVSVVFAALNGYAALSTNWGGNPMEGARPGEPNTDWGAVDATQQHNDHYGTAKPDRLTLDAVESPRNNNWFLLVLAARRGLTFLEQQPEVDPARLGVGGHSMGGKLTVDLAGIDSRVKVAAPSCGGAGSADAELAARPGSGLRGPESPLLLATIDDRAYLPRVACPLLYLGPTNDFNGPLDAVAANWRAVPSHEVRYAVSPHLNHRHTPEFAVCEYLWYEQHLRGGPALPRTPELSVALDAPDGVPTATVRPDRPAEVTRVSLMYAVDPHVLTRFWRSAECARQGDAWTAKLPVPSTDQPLFVLANVFYPLARTFQSYQWLGFDGLKEYGLSAVMQTIAPAQLQAAGIKATVGPQLLIDDFAHGWQDWYRLEWRNPNVWAAATRKVKDAQWRGPDGARLAVDVQSPKDVTLVVRVRVNDWGAFGNRPSAEFAAAVAVQGGAEWRTVTFGLSDFLPANERVKGKLESWRYLTELELCGTAEVVKDGGKVKLGGGSWPEPRQLRNLRWVDGG
jgi:hypothetical protein